MKRILHLLVLLIIALCFMPAAYAENPVDRPVNTSSLDDIFASRGVNGTLVIYDIQKNGYWLHYGTESIGGKIDSFWLEGPLKISALEQVKLLTALARRQLPYPQKAQQQACDITVLKQTDACTLHGKTGWATDNIKTPVGWFVGWAETKDNLYVFAMNMDLTGAADLPLRESITLECLRSLKLL